MTKEEVANLIEQIPDFLTPDEFLVALATKAAEVEREACAKVCDLQSESHALSQLEKYRARFIADAIRARGER